MRLVGQIYVTVASQRVQRDPSFLERVKRSLGGRINLETDEVQNQLEATAVVDGVRRALARLEVGNALSLVIDDTVIFQDSDGKADDLPDLVLALSEHASVFGRGFRELKFAAEHEEAGLHLVIETRARTRHRKQDPAAVISVGGRMRQLEPQKGESAEAYRARVEPLIRDAASFETARLSFEAFVTRLRDALAAVMPDAKVEERKAEARVVKTPADRAAPPERLPREPTHPAYDPFIAYYPSPMATVLDAMLFVSFMNMMIPPPVMLVSPLGAPLGTLSDVQAHPELADVVDDDRGGFDQDEDYGQSSDDGHVLAHHQSEGTADPDAGGDNAGGDWSDGGWSDGGWDSGGGDGGGWDGGGGD